jgi:PII-like signaling protein
VVGAGGRDVIGMRLDGPVRRLTVVVDETDRAEHSGAPVYREVVRLAREVGLAGASAFHGIEGYGASRHVHVSRVLSLSPDLPVAVVVVDTPDRIDAFLPLVQHLVTDGLITVDDLSAIGRRRGGEAGSGRGATGTGRRGLLRGPRRRAGESRDGP